jgi:hypothetical protein
MQATLQLQAAAPASACRRPQQTRCPAVGSMAPKQQRAAGASAPKVGLASQRSVAAQANIKPMEATFTDFNLVDKTQKVRRGRRAVGWGWGAWRHRCQRRCCRQCRCLPCGHSAASLML